MGSCKYQCKLTLLLCWNFFFVNIHFFFLVLSTLLFLFLLSPISSLLYFLILSTSFIPSHLTLFPFISHSLGNLFISFIFPHHPAHSFTFLFSLLLSTPSYPFPSLVLLPTLPHPLSLPSIPAFLPSLPPSFFSIPFLSSPPPSLFILTPSLPLSLPPSLLPCYLHTPPFLPYSSYTLPPFFPYPLPLLLPPSLFSMPPFTSPSLSPCPSPSLPFLISSLLI